MKYQHVIDQILKEQQHKKDNGPIDMTADQLWKYSGQIEKYNDNYKALILESIEIKVNRLPIKSRKEYFKLYWLKNKNKKL